MGSVYLAFDNQLMRHVALKIPIFDQRNEPEMIQRFYREGARGCDPPQSAYLSRVRRERD